MSSFSKLSTLAALGLGLLQLASAQDPSAQLYIGNGCDGGPNTYFLYTYPQNTDKCITIGAPGFPFFSTDAVTQCGDYTNGGADSSECNNYPQNAMAVELTGSIKCTFYTSEDCSEGDKVNVVSLSGADTNACQDFPPQFPLSYKQTYSSFTCVNV